MDGILLPHSYGRKRSFSVHLRFNLSQEFYVRPIGVDDLRRAELRLTREKLFSCGSRDCSSEDQPSSEGQNHDPSSGDRRPQHSNGVSRYQKVLLYQVLDYDSHGDPMTRLHHTMRVDTSRSDQLVFDIHDIIIDWIRNPSKNYGIFIRVTDADDDMFKREVPSGTETDAISENQSSFSNASSTNLSTNVDTLAYKLEDHIRLRREFRSTSESEYFWNRNRPTLMLFFQQPGDPSRRHVKRDHTAAGTETDLNDTPDTNPTDTSSISLPPATPNHNNPHVASTEHTSLYPKRHDVKIDSERQVQVNKSRGSSGLTASNSRQKHSAPIAQPVSKRDKQSNPTSQQSRNRPQTVQPSNTQKGRSRVKSAKADDKCGKRMLSINFDEVGWSSWIIAPQAYFANYCYGDCTLPMADNANATNHAIIQSIFHSVGRIVPRSCCAPTKLGRMAILYQLDGGVQMRHYDDMIVESCGCL